MTRQKTKLEFIEDDYSRKTCFKKRKKSLLKKLEEITTLCGIPACAIIYSPYDSDPESWPSHQQAVALVQRFRSLPPIEQTKKMMNHDEFLRARISALEEQLKKLQVSNREKKLKQVMYACLTGASFQGLAMEDMVDLDAVIEQTMEDVRKSIGVLGSSIHHELPPLPPSLPPGLPLEPVPQDLPRLNVQDHAGFGFGNMGMGGMDAMNMNPAQMEPWMTMPRYNNNVDHMIGFGDLHGLDSMLQIVPFAAGPSDDASAAGPTNVNPDPRQLPSSTRSGPTYAYNYHLDPLWPNAFLP